MTDQNPLGLSLGWVIAYVDDPGRQRVLRATFGFAVEFSSPSNEYAQLDAGPTKLAFAAYTLGDANVPGGVQRAPLAGPPPNIEIVLATTRSTRRTRAAVEAGCEALAAPEDKPHGQRVSYVRDPFGMLVEIASPM